MRTIIVGLGASMMLLAAGGSPVDAEVIDASPERYVLRQEAQSPLSPDALWERLIDPARWWHPDHTYSGDAANLSLDASAGGSWREDWAGGSVEHGRVLLVMDGTMLRLNAPFGPLQELAVSVVWTIKIAPHEDGSTVTFEEVANGTSGSALDSLAPAVDYVKTEAINRLTASH